MVENNLETNLKDCPCTNGTTHFSCENCPDKPGKDEIERLIKIYATERKTWLVLKGDSTMAYGEYWRSVMIDHLEKVQSFTTKEELDEDLQTHLRMTFDDWYNSL